MTTALTARPDHGESESADSLSALLSPADRQALTPAERKALRASAATIVVKRLLMRRDVRRLADDVRVFIESDKPPKLELEYPMTGAVRGLFDEVFWDRIGAVQAKMRREYVTGHAAFRGKPNTWQDVSNIADALDSFADDLFS